MILTPVVTWLIFFTLFIIMIIIVIMILKRLEVDYYGPRALVVFVLLSMAPFLFDFWLTPVVVVESKTAVHSFYAFGTPAFKFKDGSSQPVSTTLKNIVVNNTESPLQFETLHYGKKTFLFGGDPTLPPPVDIQPYSSSGVSNDIDYMLTPEVPSSIKIDNADKTVSRYWLHVK